MTTTEKKDSRVNKPRNYLDEHKIKQDPHDCGLADDLWDFEVFKQNFKIVVIR